MIQETIVIESVKDLANQFDEIIHKGLNLKGYTFFDKLELEIFIKENCRCEDYEQLKQRIYYVKDIPFLLHNYEVVYEPINYNQNNITMSANWGYYKYL